ncbi:zinc metallopeptidase [Anaerosalibacter bizertensis]|uniref:Zinc metallopeptidase n=1 Tax=Anaerosalibacter bizertensis TaxID=932217 RepID=A0A9Q4FKM6_9FIRM|nr:zinc metallopeptidase [Anaerosalibacter bizertensis]MBV1816606.1 zinc metallopeptidase [Bacteroidales bacterium MSK.15.36]MCB5558590.1 zinc metallopeptidase [Anaerosalibacter bizertensis]MCG4563993.1 zinc metallopeptidase [Anaerosalibacter bizertensis]MCG4581773.1 zinc metallopeptidase [Anaerosalibacter bizertensis]MCG4585983.1 zinc metallopeptidase [Anaerosalibacter bizertensis]
MDYYFLLMIALIISFYAQIKVSTTFNKYLRVPSYSGYTGREVARMILDRNGLHDVRIEPIGGQLTDHYDPRTNVIRLSSNVYNGNSIASLSVAAHEVGHAIQHAEGYFPLILRNNIAPIASISARFVWILIFLGFLISPVLLEAGIILYLAIVLFQVVTLPVEFNASRRALYQLDSGIVTSSEIGPAKKVLSAAALTYVAATLVAIGQLLRLISLSDRRN